MALTAATLKSAKQAISNVPDVQVRIALSKMLDILSSQMGGYSGTVTFASDLTITVANGVITGKTSS